MSGKQYDAVLETLTGYVQSRLAAEGEREVGPATPLVSTGLLKSLETARLLAFVHQEFGVRIPASELARRNFETLDAISSLVSSLLEPVV
jgi:acyl carrier protein